MNKYKLIIALIIFILVIASLGFYYVTTNREAPDFKEGIVMPQSISINDKKIDDQVVLKTLLVGIEKSPLEKAAKRDQSSINKNDRVFSIHAIYSDGDPQSGRLDTIEVLSDGTFIASKIKNGKLQYVKGKFGSYTMDFLTGVYSLQP
jgi:preprotein translocase subunit SecF